MSILPRPEAQGYRVRPGNWNMIWAGSPPPNTRIRGVVIRPNGVYGVLFENTQSGWLVMGCGRTLSSLPQRAVRAAMQDAVDDDYEFDEEGRPICRGLSSHVRRRRR